MARPPAPSRPVPPAPASATASTVRSNSFSNCGPRWSANPPTTSMLPVTVGVGPHPQLATRGVERRQRAHDDEDSRGQHEREPRVLAHLQHGVLREASANRDRGVPAGPRPLEERRGGPLHEQARRGHRRAAPHHRRSARPASRRVSSEASTGRAACPATPGTGRSAAPSIAPDLGIVGRGEQRPSVGPELELDGHVRSADGRGA